MDELEFLESVWGPQGEGFAVLSFKEDGAWRDLAYKFPRDEIELPDARLGDVYFCPNLFREGRRRKGFMVPSCWLYADLDNVRPYQLEAIHDLFKPSIAMESSPDHYQALWLLDEHVEEEEHSLMNQKLTYKLGADKSGWDVTQVLRVPGTVNHKYAEKPEVKLLWT